MNREDHLQWAKDRAIEYVKTDDLKNAWASMASDLRKHDELATHAGIELGYLMFFGGHLDTPQKMKEFIQGFN